MTHKHIGRLLYLTLALLLARCTPAAPLDDVRVFVKSYCLECHDSATARAGLDLERFRDEAKVMADRQVWASVFEKVESGQMPPPRQNAQPKPVERDQLLAWIAGIAAQPDPALGTIDPGRPPLRHLTRLEYNNAVRDLLGMEIDLFMFPERLPFADKSYFQPASGKMGESLRVVLRQYGAAAPALLRQSGLPGDNRAEHGFSNRGKTMNISPLLLEKYIATAGEIVNHPDLPRRSAVFAELIGVDPAKMPMAKVRNSEPAVIMPAVGVLDPARQVKQTATGSALEAAAFAKEVGNAFAEGRGGVYVVHPIAGAQTVAGKGGLIKVAFGASGVKTLEINPNIDLWLVSFGTATPSSGNLLIANKVKGEKVVELSLSVRTEVPERIEKLGLCVLGRKGQSGLVKVTAVLTDETQQSAETQIADGTQGTTFFSFAAHPGESIKRVIVDGSQIKGDYLLLDDIAFITDGKAIANAPPPAALEPQAKLIATQPSTRPAIAHRPPRDRLAEFVGRAFRRAVANDEVDRYFALYTNAVMDGKSEADAMRMAVQAVLAAPSFLYVAEPVKAGAGKVRRLEDHELATRLALFLWSSTPDRELRSLADAGKLKDEVVLEAQVKRMLSDPRARELSESFAAQWLRLDQLYTAKPDRQLFKSFYAGPQGLDTLHGAMLIEALLLFETVQVEDRSILDFVNADYTWLNPRLAALYGISLGDADATAVADGAIVPGQPNREIKKDNKSANNTWRRISLADHTRGGFLTMAGPLTLTSLPFRTSPVKRGAWLLETVFNRPPTEPKVAFVLKDDTKESTKEMSVRQRFEEHRDKPACFTCHVRLDPPGFALETFDPIGAWRSKDGTAMVDAKGTWNGTPFDGPAQFKAALMSNPHEFVRGFIEHLLSYALGRQLEIYDMPEVSRIEQAARKDGYRFERIVREVVLSYPFRNVRNLPEETR